jgi:rod shape-determining protein MreD
MIYAIGVPFLALLAVLQSSILSYWRLLDGRPDLVLIAVVAWGLTGRARETMVWGLIGGLFLDLFSGLPVGTSSLVLVLIAYLASFLEGRFWEANLLLPLVVMLIASLVYHFFGFGAIVLSGRGIDFVMALSRIILPSTFLNLLLVLPVAQLAKSAYQRIFPPEVSI